MRKISLFSDKLILWHSSTLAQTISFEMVLLMSICLDLNKFRYLSNSSLNYRLKENVNKSQPAAINAGYSNDCPVSTTFVSFFIAHKELSIFKVTNPTIASVKKTGERILSEKISYTVKQLENVNRIGLAESITSSAHNINQSQPSDPQYLVNETVNLLELVYKQITETNLEELKKPEPRQDIINNHDALIGDKKPSSDRVDNEEASSDIVSNRNFLHNAPIEDKQLLPDDSDDKVIKDSGATGGEVVNITEVMPLNDSNEPLILKADNSVINAPNQDQIIKNENLFPEKNRELSLNPQEDSVVSKTEEIMEPEVIVPEIVHVNRRPLLSPHFGDVVQIHVQKGQLVTLGQPLLIISVMKMKWSVIASCDALITDVFIIEGEKIVLGQSLVEFVEEII